MDALAQETAASSDTSSTPPAPSANGFNPQAPARPVGGPRVLNRLSPEQEQVGLRFDTPAYFTRVFHSILQAPLPQTIFGQGGAPTTIPEKEVDPDITGRVRRASR